MQVRESDQLSYPVRQVASLDMVPERTPCPPAEKSLLKEENTIRRDPCDYKGHAHTHTPGKVNRGELVCPTPSGRGLAGVAAHGCLAAPPFFTTSNAFPPNSHQPQRVHSCLTMPDKRFCFGLPG